MKKTLFGSSGIRGLANIEITPLLVQKIGSALATIKKGSYTVVGRDVRVTGPMFENALLSGITSGGGNAGLVDVLPTPVIAWLTKELDADYGLAITASHNPPEYNGLKIFNENGLSLTQNEQKQLEKVLISNRFEICDWDNIGKVERLNISDKYVEALKDSIIIERTWKVACDLYCGATATIAKKIFNSFGAKTNFINGQPDGYFPAGNPEPTKETLQRLVQVIKTTKADIGFGFDGDGDRMMVVDENGVPISGDKLLATYARHIVEKNGGGVIVTHVGASLSVEDMVEPVNGKVIRVKVGDSFIAEEMVRQKAVFGGEPIGAWIMPEIHMCPDGLLSALKLMEALEDKELKLSEFVAKTPEYPNENIKIVTKNKTKLMKVILKNYRKIFPKISKVNTLDGLRIEFEDGWILIRASGTEPIIRLTAECRDKDNLENIIEKGKNLIKLAEGMN
jgi:phosphoglucosamine mutase